MGMAERQAGKDPRNIFVKVFSNTWRTGSRALKLWPLLSAWMPIDSAAA